MMRGQDAFLPRDLLLREYAAPFRDSEEASELYVDERVDRDANLLYVDSMVSVSAFETRRDVDYIPDHNDLFLPAGFGKSVMNPRLPPKPRETPDG